MRHRLHLLAALPALLLAACADQLTDPLHPDPLPTFSAEPGAMAGVPPRDPAGNRWLVMSNEELWDYIVTHDTTVVVGLKAPGAARGIWRGQLLITAAQRAAARLQVQQIAGVQLIEESASLPALEVKVRSLQALSLLRALPVADYVEPAVMEVEFASTKGCEYPWWSGTAGTTFAGDVLPPHYARASVQIDRAWNRARGDGVVVGITDTGVSYYQRNLTYDFASGHSHNRWAEGRSTIPSSGGTAPAWHDECGHGTRMAGSIVAPMNSNNIAGVAWRSHMLAVRFTNDVIMPRTINTVEAIGIAALDVPWYAQGTTDHRRIVTMAWGSHSVYELVKDQIEWRYYVNGTLFIGASGTTAWGISHAAGVIFPASLPEVIAVSAVNLDYSRSSEIHYGSQVELSFFLEQITTGFLTPDIVRMGGSSGATAIVSGIAALVWSRYPWMTRDQVRQHLRWAGHNYPNHNSTVGFGVPNAMRAVGGMYAVALEEEVIEVQPNAYTRYRITALPRGGDGPFTYQWEHGPTTPSIEVYVIAGETRWVTVTVTDTSDGTSKLASISVFGPQPPGGGCGGAPCEPEAHPAAALR